MADWTDVIPDANDETREALEELTEASALYERYVQLAGIHTYPAVADLEPLPDFVPETETPLGFVLSPSPIGVAVYKRT